MGEFYAVACALVWAFAVILFRKSGEHVDPFSLNFYRVVISSALLVATLLVTGKPLLGQASSTDTWILLASGVIAIAISDTLFHMCLNRVGAGINAIVDSLYSPFIILFAFLLLDERLGPNQYAGMALIIGGVLLASRIQPPRGISRGTLWAGILLGVGAMATLGFGIVLAKPAITRTDVLWATAVRQVGALAALSLVTLVHPRRRAIVGVLKPDRSWRYSFPGAFLGSYVALVLWIAGMKYTQTGTAGILNQSSTFFILALATLILREPFSRRKALSALLTVAGIVLTVI